MVFTVEATVDQCLAVGTTQTGHDLYISNNANTNMTSRSRLGSTYQYPPGQHGTFLTGDEYFIVTDCEVFGL